MQIGLGQNICIFQKTKVHDGTASVQPVMKDPLTSRNLADWTAHRFLKMKNRDARGAMDLLRCSRWRTPFATCRKRTAHEKAHIHNCTYTPPTRVDANAMAPASTLQTGRNQRHGPQGWSRHPFPASGHPTVPVANSERRDSPSRADVSADECHAAEGAAENSYDRFGTTTVEHRPILNVGDPSPNSSFNRGTQHHSQRAPSATEQF